jgi:hypothetical protein
VRNQSSSHRIRVFAAWRGCKRPFWTKTHSQRAVQLARTAPLLGRPNHLVVGAAYDRGVSDFGASSELGTIDPDLFVNGTGVTIGRSIPPIAPERLPWNACRRQIGTGARHSGLHPACDESRHILTARS